MKVNGTARLGATPERVFAALHDPAVLVATIPGVQALHQVADDRYSMTIVAGVASVKGAYDGEVSLSQQQPPTSFTLRAKGSGAPGTVDATVRVTLEAAGDGTLLAYDADAVVGGMVGGVGQRMLSGVAKRTAGQFFGNVDAVLAGALPVDRPPQGDGRTPSVAAADESEVIARVSIPADPMPTPQWFASPPSEPAAVDEMRVPFWIVLAGVGVGAFWALAGVLVGQHVARRRS